ncbi:MAG TPA: sulfatase-like hydrolase/transferase, partial [Vicinamibacteria bacterium]|nr:sulfatase-like hydrolase/transferase [Vicinamibacteria bacterium]
MDLAAEHRFAEAYLAPEYRLEGSDPGEVAFLDARWRGAAPNGQGFLSTGASAAFVLPLVPMPLSVTVSLLPDWGRQGERLVTLRMNGAPLLTFAAPTQARQRVDIPPEQVRAGTNELEIECRGARSFRVRRLLVRPRLEGRIAGRDPARGSWVEPAGHTTSILQIPGAQLSYYVRPPRRALLRFDLPPAHGGTASYTVRIRGTRGLPEAVFMGKSGDGRVEMPLAASEGTPLRIAFDVKRLSSGPGPVAFPWGSPRLLCPSVPRNAAPSPGRSLGGPARKLPNIVLYVMDALRADHLETYGYDRPTSPEVAKFSRDALVFDHAYAQSVWTRPCVGSLLTGLFPDQHLAVNDVGHLSESVKLLSSHLRRLGYTSIGLQSNAN